MIQSSRLTRAWSVLIGGEVHPAVGAVGITLLGLFSIPLLLGLMLTRLLWAVLQYLHSRGIRTLRAIQILIGQAER